MMETEVGGLCFKMEEEVIYQGMQATLEARKLKQNFPRAGKENAILTTLSQFSPEKSISDFGSPKL